MAKINWTTEAEHWLKEIFDYIASDNPESAAFVHEIFHRQEGYL
jgi:plasmid stabilization system protein ParE